MCPDSVLLPLNVILTFSYSFHIGILIIQIAPRSRTPPFVDTYIILQHIIISKLTIYSHKGTVGRQLIIDTQFLQFNVKYLLYMYYIFTANLFMYID